MKKLNLPYNKIFNIKFYNKSYYLDRNINNKKRNVQFLMDGEFLKKYKSQGKICDVGCASGEFLKSIGWVGDRYGIEINSQIKREAEKNGINFNKNIFTEKNYFDVVVFRGTIQHLIDPFRSIKAAYTSLKKNGIIVFLVTPNTDSILYRLKLDLPLLVPNLNFYIPGEKNLSYILKNIGFKEIEVEYPYWKTPYREFPKDFFLFILNLFSSRFYKHAFYKSIISLVAKKN